MTAREAAEFLREAVKQYDPEWIDGTLDLAGESIGYTTKGSGVHGRRAPIEALDIMLRAPSSLEERARALMHDEKFVFSAEVWHLFVDALGQVDENTRRLGPEMTVSKEDIVGDKEWLKIQFTEEQLFDRLPKSWRKALIAASAVELAGWDVRAAPEGKSQVEAWEALLEAARSVAEVRLGGRIGFGDMAKLEAAIKRVEEQRD